jgi:hypothetical protein
MGYLLADHERARPVTALMLGFHTNLGQLLCGDGWCLNSTGGCGVIYKLGKTSQYSTLHSFTDTDGAVGGEMVFGKDGSLYGVTSAGGTGSCTGATNGCGVIFKYTP